MIRFTSNPWISSLHVTIVTHWKQSVARSESTWPTAWFTLLVTWCFHAKRKCTVLQITNNFSIVTILTKCTWFIAQWHVVRNVHKRFAAKHLLELPRMICDVTRHVCLLPTYCQHVFNTFVNLCNCMFSTLTWYRSCKGNLNHLHWNRGIGLLAASHNKTVNINPYNMMTFGIRGNGYA